MGLSLLVHLLLLAWGVFLSRSLSPFIPPPESVCFVNMVDFTPARGETGGRKGDVRSHMPPAPSRGGEAQTGRAIPSPHPPLPQPLTRVSTPLGAAVPAKIATPLPSPSGGIPTGGATTVGGGAGGAAAGGGSGGTGRGGGHGGAGDGPPGEVGFGTASGISYAHQVKPAYPPLARRFNREGRVLLRLTVAETGALVNVDILEDPGFGLAAAAVEAVRRSRFNPARREGKPFTAQALLPVRFTLGGGE